MQGNAGNARRCVGRDATPPGRTSPPLYTLEHQGTPAAAAATAAAPATRRRHGRTCFGFKGSGHTEIKCKEVLEV